MSNQEIVTYIKQQQQQGVSRIIITASLTAAGWKNNVIDQAFIDSQNSQQEINSRNTNIYTEKNYPIQTRWIIKNLIHLVLLINNFSNFTNKLFESFLGKGWFKTDFHKGP